MDSDTRLNILYMAMATTVVSWLLTSAYDAVKEAQSELNARAQPAPSLSSYSYSSRPRSGTATAAFLNALAPSSTPPAPERQIQPFPPIAPELRLLITSHVPPSKLFTTFRQISPCFKYTIEQILAPQWLKEGRLILYLQLDDVPMKDFKNMLEFGMAYGPNVKGPVELKRMTNDWDDERQKCIPFTLDPSSLSPTSTVARFQFPYPRDARRNKLSQKLGSLPGNTISVSFKPLLLETDGPDFQYTLSPAVEGNFAPRTTLPADVAKSIKEGIVWNKMEVEVDWMMLLTRYFWEVERQERAQGRSKGSGRYGWTKWYSSPSS